MGTRRVEITDGIECTLDQRFGAPTIAGTGISAEIVASRFFAGESVNDLTGDYDLSAAQVEAAIRFEADPVEKAAKLAHAALCVFLEALPESVGEG